MAAKEPSLDITYMDLHSPKLMGITDISYYPTGFGIVSPTLEVSIPGYNTVFVPFTPKALQVLNSTVLEVTGEDECFAELPDGLYTFRYSIYPAYKYYVDKTVLRVDALYRKFDTFFLTLELDCKSPSSVIKKQLDEVRLYIEGAVAAANNCANKLAIELYNKASKLLDGLIKTNG
jgi:hypothetical protein